MKLIVGLGNPGKEYQKTRHNVGFMVIDRFLETHKLEPLKNESKYHSELNTYQLEGQKIIVAKPMTFMNLSGQAVAAISQFYKIAPADIFVIYDDLDLPLGHIRIRPEGGPGTHNGMKSIVEHLGTQNFPRIRIGIESRGKTSFAKQNTTQTEGLRPTQKTGFAKQNTSSFVLSPFTREEKKLAEESFKKAEKAIVAALNSSIEAAMNLYNT